MKKIILSGEIGWDIEPFMVRAQLEDAGGEDLDVHFSGPGGSIFPGIEIFNMFRDYKREHPGVQMISNVKGIAASMMSYLVINEVFDMVTVEDNAAFMIHNPIMRIAGDYQEMQKAGDFLDRFAAMVAVAYSNRSGKSIKETREMMDAETWFFGQEIVDAGFADEIIKTENDKNKPAAIASAELSYRTVMKKVREAEIEQDDFEKVAALIKDYDPANLDSKNKNQKSAQPASGGNNKQEVIIMNIDELKKQHPDLYAEIKAEMMKAGADQEKERVKLLLEMKKKKDFEGIEAIHNRIDDAIEKGETTQDVHSAIAAMNIKGGAVSGALESPGDIDPGSSNSVSGEESKSDDEGEF